MKNLLVAEHIVKNYASHCALNDVSFTIPEGQICGLLGPNGAGKTSLIRIITQITAADSGQIWFDGQPLTPAHTTQIGYLPEERGLYKKMKVGEQLLYLAQIRGMSKAEAIDKLRDWLTRFEMKEWWNKNVEDLSKGMQQKVQFVATVLHQPKLLILDEPFTGFDPINANAVKDEILRLKAEGTTVIFSTHRMESVEELCDHIILINKSQKILDGATRQIRHEYKNNVFALELKAAQPPILDSAVQIISCEQPETNVWRMEVQLPPTIPANQLLYSILEKGEVLYFAEQIPTIGQIFVSKVKEAEKI